MIFSGFQGVEPRFYRAAGAAPRENLGRGHLGVVFVFSAAKRATRFLSLFGWSSGRVSEFKPLKVTLLGDLNKFWGDLHNGNWISVWFPFKPTPDIGTLKRSHTHMVFAHFVCLFVCLFVRGRGGGRWAGGVWLCPLAHVIFQATHQGKSKPFGICAFR